MIRIKRQRRTQRLIAAEIDQLVGRHISLRVHKIALLKYHTSYERDHKRCPLSKDNTLNALKTKYPQVRATIIESFLGGESSGNCVYCGRSFGDRLDHFHPKSKVPQYSLDPANLFWACNACNESKGHKRPFSELQLFHPLFDNVFKGKSALFDVKLRNMSFDSNSELVLDLSIVPISGLRPSHTKRVNSILQKMKIKHRVIGRVDAEIRDFYRSLKRSHNRTLAMWLPHCKERVRISKNSNYTAYFAYKILSQKRVLKRLLNGR